MPIWMRKSALIIAGKTFTFDDLEYAFEIPFEDSEDPDVATVTIKNMSESTRSVILRNATLTVNAGYEGDTGCLFVGEVSSVTSRHDGAEWETVVTAVAAMENWLRREVNKTYRPGTLASQIVPDLVGLFGIEIGVLKLKRDICYARGKVCRGKLKDILIEIAVDDCKSRLLIRDGRLIINDPSLGVHSGYVLSQANGLLKSAGDAQETPIVGGLTTRLDSRDRQEAETLVKRTCLLNAHIGAGDVIGLHSKRDRGTYQVVRGSHVGSRSGEHVTHLELRPI
jgi:hypothetical protein